MYGDWAVRLLAVLLLMVISWLIYGLYGYTEDTTKIQIGVHFKVPSETTEHIMKRLEASSILKPIELSEEEGLLAVEEGRIECFFVFKQDMGMNLAKEGYKEMIDMYMVKGNHLPYIITDILAGEFIGEVTVTEALLYLEKAIELANIPIEKGYYEKIHIKWRQKIDEKRTESFIQNNIVMPDNVSGERPVILENNILFKQVILGTIYVFLTFYLVFLVVNMVRDYETGVRKKWFITSMSTFSIVVGEYISLILGSLPIILVMTGIQYLYDGRLLYFFIINLLFVVSYSGAFMLMGKLIGHVTVYVLLATGITIIIGIVSGSFFLIDTTHRLIGLVAYLTPTHHLLKEVAYGNIIGADLPRWSYMSYMVMYGGTFLGIIYLFESLWLRKGKGI